MIYSVRYAHLEKPLCKVGDILNYGDKIGIEGTTGISTGVHLHLDVVEGVMNKSWLLSNMVSKYKPSKQECEYFIEDDIWTKGQTEIKTHWLGYTNHYAYDIVNKIKNSRELQWNRSFVGNVSAVGYNAGYGNFVIVVYDKTVKSQPISNETSKPTTNIQNDLKKQIEALDKEISVYKDNIIKKDKKILELSNENDLLRSKIVNVQKIVN